MSRRYNDAERLGALLLHGDDSPATIAGMYQRGELVKDAGGLVILKSPKSGARLCRDCGKPEHPGGLFSDCDAAPAAPRGSEHG